MLLGIVEAIGDLFGNLFSWLIRKLVVPVVQALIIAVVNVVKYCFGYLFYLISVFLLQLIDFVEMLFRSLAGLEPKGGQYLSFATSVEEGSEPINDMLITLLRSEAVLNAFYACAIAGIFLLAITTIFQMIKVEYTTEGANNSKTSILGKSLKSLTNMLLIPLLVVFGVFIGNQVLQLIDTATSGEMDAKISGLLFVTAASEAQWVDEGKIGFYKLTFNEEDANEDSSLVVVKDASGVLSFAISTGIELGFRSVLNTLLPEGEKKDTSKIIAEYSTITKDVESGFMSVTPGMRYYAWNDVVKYFNFFEINYLVLIFGACIIIKCLFFSAFGMIDRIYQCLALFIVSPMVIGMSPVKDSLGAWRTKFISKALSAYGTIISLNLFFTIVKALLAIQIIPVGFEDAGSQNIGAVASILYSFSGPFMAGILKAIFVIVGCLMIEKLAGDLGGYFGGGNAMAEGKALASETTKGITSAAKFATGVGMMGAGIAGKVAKGAGGLIGKIPVGKKDAEGNRKTLGGVVKKGVSSANAGLNNFFFGKHEKKEAEKRESLDNAKSDLTKAEFGLSQAEEKMKGAKKGQRDDLDLYKKAQLAGDKKTMAEIRKKYTHPNGSSKGDLINKYFDAEDEIGKAEDKVSSAQKAVDKTENAFGVGSAWRKNAKENVVKSIFKADAGLRHIGSEGLQQIVPGPLRNAGKAWNDAVEKGASSNPELQEMLEAEKKAKQEKAQKKVENSLLVGSIIAHRETAAQQTLMNELLKAGQKNQEEANKNMKDLATNLKGLMDEIIKLQNKKNSGQKLSGQEELDLNSKLAQAQGIESDMKQINKNVKVDWQNNQIINAKVDFDMTEFKRNMEAAIKKHATSDEINEIISKQFKEWGDKGNETILKELRKIAEDLKAQIK